MSSNNYSGCVSRNLVRTSTFGYRETASLCALLETAGSRDAQRKLPLASLRAFPDFGFDRTARVRTAPVNIAPLPL